MLKKNLAVITLIASVVLFAGLLSAQSLEEFEKKIHEYTLPNGLHVIILENHSAPVVSFVTHVDAGSANEVVGKTGLAHFLEHMAFKGTTRYGTKDYNLEKPLFAKIDGINAQIVVEKRKFNPDAKKIEKLEKEFKTVQKQLDKLAKQAEFMAILKNEGATGLDAGTDADLTIYIVSLPANKAELWAMIEAHRFNDSVFREFFKERDVIVEERGLRVDSQPFGRLLEEFQAISFKSHPYTVNTIGHMSDIKNLTRKDIRDFFNKYYVVSNMTIAIVGDVNPETMIGHIRKYWGSMPRVDKPAPPITVEPDQLGEKTVTIREKTQPILILGYHKPALSHPDSTKLELLSSLLAQGRTSRLHNRLVKKDKSAIATFTFTGYPGTKYPGLILVAAVPSQGHKPEKVRDVIYEEIEKLKNDVIPTDELNKVKIQAKANLIRGLDSNLGMAINLAR